ncbi:MAG: hypothetical protein ACI4JF_06960 [Oscillospiraceae bacterium]
MNDTSAAAKTADNKVSIKKLSGHGRVTDDMMVCFAITFTAAAMHYVGNMPQRFTDIYNAVLLMLFVFTWLWASCRSGMKGRWPFAVFTSCFWLIPQIVISLYESGPAVFGLSITAYVLSEAFGLLIMTPVRTLGELVGLEGAAPTVIFFIFCAVSYLGGMLVKERRRSTHER